MTLSRYLLNQNSTLTAVKVLFCYYLLGDCLRLLHKGESLCCFRDSASVTYGGMLPSDLTLSALRFILSAKSRQSCKQDCETVDFCNSLYLCAITSISTSPPLGRVLTATAERAGKAPEKCFS